MPELFLLAIACLLPGSPLIAGLRDQLLDWIESLGEAISGRTAWAARLAPAGWRQTVFFSMSLPGCVIR